MVGTRDGHFQCFLVGSNIVEQFFDGCSDFAILRCGSDGKGHRNAAVVLGIVGDDRTRVARADRHGVGVARYGRSGLHAHVRRGHPVFNTSVECHCGRSVGEHPCTVGEEVLAFDLRVGGGHTGELLLAHIIHIIYTVLLNEAPLVVGVIFVQFVGIPEEFVAVGIHVFCVCGVIDHRATCVGDGVIDIGTRCIDGVGRQLHLGNGSLQVVADGLLVADAFLNVFFGSVDGSLEGGESVGIRIANLHVAGTGGQLFEQCLGVFEQFLGGEDALSHEGGTGVVAARPVSHFAVAQVQCSVAFVEEEETVGGMTAGARNPELIRLCAFLAECGKGVATRSAVLFGVFRAEHHFAACGAVLDVEALIGVTHECPFRSLVLGNFRCQAHVGIVFHEVEVVVAFQLQAVVDEVAALAFVEGNQRVFLHRGRHFDGLPVIYYEIDFRIVVEEALVELCGQLRDGGAKFFEDNFRNQVFAILVLNHILDVVQRVVVEVELHVLSDFLRHVELRAVGQGGVRELVALKRGNGHLADNASDGAELKHIAVGCRESLETHVESIVGGQRGFETGKV